MQIIAVTLLKVASVPLEGDIKNPKEKGEKQVINTNLNHTGDAHRKLFAAVVLAALDDAILDEQKRGNGAESIARWAASRDGQTVLSCAGITPSERCIEGLKGFVERNVRTSTALTRAQSVKTA